MLWSELQPRTFADLIFICTKAAPAVGYQCHDDYGHEVPNLTMNNLIKSVRPTGGIGVVGVFVPKDPGASDTLAQNGQIAFDFGSF